MNKFLDQFRKYRKYRVTLIYPEDRVIGGDRLVGWLSDAVANGECPRMPDDWEDALELAMQHLDITISQWESS